MKRPAPDSPSGKLILHQQLRAHEGSQARTGRILRAIGLGGQILSDLGIQRIRLLSNNPEKVRQLEAAGIKVVERVPCQPRVHKISHAYLRTKKKKMGHLLDRV